MADPHGVGIDQYVTLIEQSQRLLAAVATFITVGLGGLYVGVRKILKHTKDVEKQVEPVQREVSDRSERSNDTLSMRVDTIVTRIDGIDEERHRQHEDNSERLGRIEDRMDRMGEDIGAIRKVMDKILTKLAGLT